MGVLLTNTPFKPNEQPVLFTNNSPSSCPRFPHRWVRDTEYSVRLEYVIVWFRVQFEKKCSRKFFKNVQNCTSRKKEGNLCVFEKLMSACFSQMSRETILLLENNLSIEMIETR